MQPVVEEEKTAEPAESAEPPLVPDEETKDEPEVSIAFMTFYSILISYRLPWKRSPRSPLQPLLRRLKTTKLSRASLR
ncbi:hypothetical protein IMZ48_03685 [Candidatus Bathyarchaeota archaeon]|nr:hypothetical protein [Candidatus Bathyarchaeota archaeon]